MPVALFNIAIVVFAGSVFAWVGIVAAAAWIVFRLRLLSSVRMRAAGAAAAALLAVLAALASIAAAGPADEDGWQMRLSDSATSVSQQVRVHELRLGGVGLRDDFEHVDDPLD